MIGIVHGYGLAGSGSNLWTREAVASMCDNGDVVHLMCQEPHPDRFDFVSEVWTYDDRGEPRCQLSREVDRAGRCILHKPALNVLPTYVRPDRSSDYVRSILDLEMDVLEEYLRRNTAALRRISAEHGIRAWHVNHAILLSEALRRLKASDGIGYAVMPHGSALEYVVQHDERMQPVARQAVDQADAIFALNQEVRDRLRRYFPDLDLEPKTITIRVGVNTERFRPVERSGRPDNVQRLAEALDDVERGQNEGHDTALEKVVAARPPDHDTFRSALEPARSYQTGNPDATLEGKLRDVDWERDRIITFVGRIIPAKGLAALVAAFPRILERHPDTRLVIVGAGWLREYLHAFLLALAQGDGDFAHHIVRWATEERQEGARPSGLRFIEALRERGEYDDYVASAADGELTDRVLFTGFLEHPLLAHVFPLADVAVFPSAVAEASPLVIPEAAACGCFPMGTDFAGMHHSLASLEPRLPDDLAALMRLDPDPDRTAFDIVAHVGQVLDRGADVREPLRNAAVEEYDWRSIADTLAHELAAIARD